MGTDYKCLWGWTVSWLVAWPQALPANPAQASYLPTTCGIDRLRALADEPGPGKEQREVEEEKGWGGQSEQDSHVLLRLRGALASGDQLASITDFI